MVAFLNACVFKPTSGGVGDFVVSAAVPGWQTPAQAGAIDATVYRYRAAVSDGSQWEIGTGTYTVGSTTLTRTTILASSTGGAKVSFSQAPDITITAFAMDVNNREQLTADRTYYVRTDGSDSNTGLVNSSGGAFLTTAKALTTVAALDCSTFNCTIQVADGTYTATINLPRMVGSGTFTLLGNPTTPANCIISVTGGGAIAALDTHGVWNVSGFKLQTTTSGNALSMSGSGRLKYANIDFGTTAGAHHIIVSGTGAIIEASGNWTISGNSTYAHMSSTYGAQLLTYSKTITLSGTRAFTIFALSQGVSIIDSGSLTFTGTATGSRYQAALNGIINTSGGGANFFPGDAVGTVVTGGQYA